MKKNAITEKKSNNQQSNQKLNYVKKLIKKFKSYLFLNYPFYGTILANLKIIPTTDLPSDIIAKTDCHSTIFINANINYQKQDFKFILFHELLHIIHFHSKYKENKDHLLWNMACDYAINSMLIDNMKLSITMLKPLYSPIFSKKSAEEIYAILLNIQNSLKQAIRTFYASNFSTTFDFSNETSFTSSSSDDSFQASETLKTCENFGTTFQFESTQSKNAQPETFQCNNAKIPDIDQIMKELKEITDVIDFTIDHAVNDLKNQKNNICPDMPDEQFFKEAKSIVSAVLECILFRDFSEQNNEPNENHYDLIKNFCLQKN